MTLTQAIGLIDTLKPNTYTDAEKIRWLSRLDGMIYETVVKAHEGSEEIDFSHYDETSDPNTELIAGAPHDDMYIKWLEAQIDYANGEYPKYNNTITAFNEIFTAFKAAYRRAHMPLGKKLKFF